MKNTLFLVLAPLTAALLTSLSSVHAAEPSDPEQQIETRRAAYLEWIVENFGPPQTRPDRRADKKSLNKQIPINKRKRAKRKIKQG